jgi:peroxiredoxin Q/BCP
MAELQLGGPAPDFEAVVNGDRKVRLADYRGRYLVLYFYPKSFTPGCTNEAKRFRDNFDELQQLGADVLGVSLDSLDAQCRFAERHELRFPLVADEGGRLANLYGVKWPLLPLARRVTFVIDPEGRVAARFAHEFQVSRHLDDVQRFLREAKAGGA